MSNPTTPFSWQMPTATDLVTDLPADFEVFGQAVATSMADLLGGASGYILSKASATDMDFAWIANDQGDITGVTATTPLTGGGSSGAITVGIQDALTTQKGAVQLSDSTSTTSSILAATPTAVKSAFDTATTANTTANAAIPKSTVTTNGDVIYATGSAAVTRLGIGSAGQVLTVASGVPSWATPTTTAVGLTLISPTSIAFTGTSASTTNGKTVFSACSSLSLNGVFTSTYDNYLIITATFTQSTSVMNLMRLRASGTDTSTSYNNAGWYQSSGGAWNTNTDDTTGVFHQQPGTSQGSSVMFIQNPNLAFATMFNNQRVIVGQGSGNMSSQNGTTQFDGLTLTQPSGNFTGTIRVYGLRNGG